MSPLSPQVYRDLPLAQHGDDIRLLRILPGRSDTPVRCEFRRVSLSDKRVNYVALSYRWSPPPESELIYVNGHPVRIRRGLHDFLVQARKRAWKRRGVDWEEIWIDALSIDQSSAAERSQQVEKMSHIFAKASLVIAWLGYRNSNLKLPIDHVRTNTGLAQGLRNAIRNRGKRRCNNCLKGTLELDTADNTSLQFNPTEPPDRREAGITEEEQTWLQKPERQTAFAKAFDAQQTSLPLPLQSDEPNDNSTILLYVNDEDGNSSSEDTSERTGYSCKSCGHRERQSETFAPKRDVQGRLDTIRNEIFRHEYWGRLWIVQELLLAREIVIVCGEEVMRWRQLEEYFAEARLDIRALRIDKHRASAEAIVRLRRQAVQVQESKSQARRFSLDLNKLLFDFDKQLCEDQRDRIFGLQGLVCQEHRIVVDYTISKEELCLEVARRLVKSALRVQRTEPFMQPPLWRTAMANIESLPGALGLNVHSNSDFARDFWLIRDQLR